MPALNLNKPADLLAKLAHELRALSADNGDAYAALNALRDAYHLREWVWHGRLAKDPELQSVIMGCAGNEEDWRKWVNQTFPDFEIVRQLCNGSKHYVRGGTVRGSYQAGWGISKWGASKWDDNGFYAEVDPDREVSVADLIERVDAFWRQLFEKHPGLG